MQFKRIFSETRSRFHRWISVLGLTRAEASFILFLSSTACIGAAIPALQDYLSNNKTETRAADSTTAEIFRRLADGNNADSATVDSLMAVMRSDTMKAMWIQRSDSLRRLFSADAGNTSIDSFIADTGDEPVRKVNINTANARALTSLPGIGPKMADRIVEYRNQKGVFRTAEDLMKVKGIGKKTFAKLKPYIDI